MSIYLGTCQNASSTNKLYRKVALEVLKERGLNFKGIEQINGDEFNKFKQFIVNVIKTNTNKTFKLSLPTWINDDQLREIMETLLSTDTGENVGQYIRSLNLSGCPQLTNLTLPEGMNNLTSLNLRGCNKLTTINIVNGSKIMGIDVNAENLDSLKKTLQLSDNVKIELIQNQPGTDVSRVTTSALGELRLGLGNTNLTRE